MADSIPIRDLVAHAASIGYESVGRKPTEQDIDAVTFAVLDTLKLTVLITDDQLPVAFIDGIFAGVSLESRRNSEFPGLPSLGRFRILGQGAFRDNIQLVDTFNQVPGERGLVWDRTFQVGYFGADYEEGITERTYKLDEDKLVLIPPE